MGAIEPFGSIEHEVPQEHLDLGPWMRLLRRQQKSAGVMNRVAQLAVYLSGFERLMQATCRDSLPYRSTDVFELGEHPSEHSGHSEPVFAGLMV